MKRASMKDVAKLAGVSQRTVSNVISDYPHVSPQMRERVMQAVQQLDYRPNLAARRLRQGKTGTLALVIPNLSWEYFARQAHLIQSQARRHGLQLLVVETTGVRSQERRVLDELHSNMVDGVLLSSIELSAEELDSLDVRVPIVLLGEKLDGHNWPHFVIDNERAAEQVATHLLQQGATRFAVLGSTGTAATSSAGRLRLQGLERQIRRAGAQVIRQLEASPWTIEGGYDAMSKALAASLSSQVDAVVALNDLLAVGALRACHEAQVSVPDQLMITGWDDISTAAYITPSLTSVRPDKSALAANAVEALIKMIAGEDVPSGDQVISHSLVVRESSLPAQATAK